MKKLPISYMLGSPSFTFIPPPIQCPNPLCSREPISGCVSFYSDLSWTQGNKTLHMGLTIQTEQHRTVAFPPPEPEIKYSLLCFSLLPPYLLSSSPPTRSSLTLGTETNLEMPGTLEGKGQGQFLTLVAQGTQPRRLSPETAFQPASFFQEALHSSFPGCGPQCPCTHSLTTFSRA